MRGRPAGEVLALIDSGETPQRPTRNFCGVADESEELGVEIRELLFGRRHGFYRILFQIDGKTVQIVRVWHGARDRVSLEDL